MPTGAYRKGMHPNTQKNLIRTGRKKGVLNKFTTVKQAFLNVLEDLGGEEFIKQYASQSRQGKRDFFNAITKMVPTKEEHEHKGNLTVKIVKFSEDKPAG